MGPAAPPDYREYRREYRRRRKSIVGPLILIALGAVFLLQNFGVLSWSFWGSVWQFWPLILVLVGLELVLGGGGRGAGTMIVGLVALLIIAGAAIAFFAGRVNGVGAFHRPTPPPAISHITTQALEGATQANVALQFGGGDVTLHALADQPDLLAQVSYDGPANQEPQASLKRSSGQVSLSYRANAEHGGGFPFFTNGTHLDFALNGTIPLNVSIQEGGSTSDLDLSQLKVANLSLETGASTTTIDMPASAGATSAAIKGGAATIDVNIPTGVAAQITYSGGVSTLNIDRDRFPQVQDKVYRSADYESAQNKLDLTLQTGVATVNVR